MGLPSNGPRLACSDTTQAISKDAGRGRGIMSWDKSKKFKIRPGSIADMAIHGVRIAAFLLVLIGMGIEL